MRFLYVLLMGNATHGSEGECFWYWMMIMISGRLRRGDQGWNFVSSPVCMMGFIRSNQGT